MYIILCARPLDNKHTEHVRIDDCFSAKKIDGTTVRVRHDSAFRADNAENKQFAMTYNNCDCYYRMLAEKGGRIRSHSTDKA